MRHLAVASILAALMATPASATTLAVWEGFVYVTATTELTPGACARSGQRPGFETGFYADAFRAVFRPAGLVDNGDDTRLLLVTPRSAFHHLWVGKAFSNSNNVPSTGLGGTAHKFDYATKFAGTTLTPAVPTVSTQTVILQARVTNLFGTADCTVTLKGSLSNRPGLTF
jgi:hypothetical protein